MTSASIWAEIDLAAIGHNVRQLRGLLRPPTNFMAVVKANGYGHGAEAAARAALDNGATRLGVARLEEGIALREVGLDAPILVFGHTAADTTDQLLNYALEATVYNYDTAAAYAARARQLKRRLPVHVKIDTGMGRLGLFCNQHDAARAAKDLSHRVGRIAALKGLRLSGLSTHFASADSRDLAFARHQLERFTRLIAQLHRDGIDVPLKHAANSAATIQLPEAHLDMVRCGIAIYGLNPSVETRMGPLHLRPAMTLKSRIIHLKSVPAGTTISYGQTWSAPRATTIATVPVGYADGYNRGLSSKGQMLVRQSPVPVVGRVCMDLTMLDVGTLPEVALHDEVVVFGRQGEAFIRADHLAGALQTINYEIVTAISARVPRVYLI